MLDMLEIQTFSGGDPGSYTKFISHRNSSQYGHVETTVKGRDGQWVKAMLVNRQKGIFVHRQNGALTIPEWLRVLRRSGASDVRVGLRRFFLLTLRTLFWSATICDESDQ
jgi:hypothetical protein